MKGFFLRRRLAGGLENVQARCCQLLNEVDDEEKQDDKAKERDASTLNWPDYWRLRRVGAYVTLTAEAVLAPEHRQ
jgi:hypothetical protein